MGGLHADDHGYCRCMLVLKLFSSGMNSVDVVWRIESEIVLCLGQSTLILYRSDLSLCKICERYWCRAVFGVRIGFD